MADRKTVLVVDDHPLFREGLKTLMARHSQFEVVGEAGTGSEGLTKARDLKPDLVLMDLSLPDESGIETTRNILRLVPETTVVVISMHAKIDYITEAFQAGAKGYVVKESATERLLECLKAVSRGEYFIDSSLSHKVVQGLMGDGEKAAVRDGGYNSLTPREQQIMRLLAEGLSPKEIADKLFISPKTVENHRANLMNKLELHSTMELVRHAAKLGLIDVDLWKG
ncbi:MAG: response regulator transcription factor [Deltaproteobacteria bacterium]|nr:response regulator transcription factor [Deltaproteobacteria bacterium]